MNAILMEKYPDYRDTTSKYTVFDMIKAFKDGVFTENQTYDLNDRYQAVVKKCDIRGSYGGINFGKLQFIIKDKLNLGNTRIFWTEGQINN